MDTENREDGSEIGGITIQHHNEQADVPAITVTGDHNRLHHLDIRTGGMGITLHQANGNHLHDLTLENVAPHRSLSNRMSARDGNGIDLFRSDANRIERITIDGVQDGVYIEQGKDNVVREVQVSNSRYGFHLMFTKRTSLIDNEAFANTTGAMIMGTQGTVVQHNRFYKQNRQVFSQGIMLYDVQEALVSHNVVAENLYGLYLDQAHDNEIVSNAIHHNYIGLEVTRSSGNKLMRNEWIGNMISARATKSEDNTIRHNFWEEHAGLDTTGDRISDIPFYADLVAPTLTQSKSIYQIFADSPGLLFLQHALELNREETLADAAPLMDRSDRNGAGAEPKNSRDAVVYGAALSFSLLVMRYMGGRFAGGPDHLH